MIIRDMLSEMHGKPYVIMVGNATTGLYIILEALGLKEKNIAIPNSVCTNVPLAVKFSGNKPVYLDISEHNLCLSALELEDNIDDIDSVIGVHGYGHVCDIKNI